MATTTTTRRGFALRCPTCGAEDALRIDLGDVHAITCRECDAELGPPDVRRLIAEWTRALAWLDTAPARDDD